MQPENEEGNIEYKLKLMDISPDRIERLATQMRYRCTEGGSECIYVLGVEDDGTMSGMTKEQYETTISCIEKAANTNSYSVTKLTETKVDDNKFIYEVLIREKNDKKYIDLKIAVAGSVDAGKCLKPDTLIVNYSGKKVRIDSIKLNDLIMGDDFTPRKVLKIYQGCTNMYLITQSDAKNYVVTENHILTLKFGLPRVQKILNKYIIIYHKGNGILETHTFNTKYDLDIFMIEINNQEVLDISVKEYLLKSDEWKLFFFGYTVSYENINKEETLSTITVTPTEYGEYYGFELDNNGRFLLSDGTVTHNSSLLGVLTSGKNDNGRGSARLGVFNFPHEIRSGRTSSVGHQIVGFNDKGENITYRNGKMLSWPEIVRNSSKVVSFYDLAGHEKYLKTTISGLSSSSPDLCFIMVGANRGVLRMTKEHIFLCLTLNIPFCLLITKVDMMENNDHILKETYDSINKILKSPIVRKVPLKIKNTEDVIRSAIHLQTNTIVPIFNISNTTGEGFDKLNQFLHLAPKKPFEKNITNVEMHIDHAWTVPSVGTVFGGHIVCGKIKIGDKLYIGPNNNKYTQITVRSIHCKKVSVQEVDCGTYACLGVRGITKQEYRKGNVIISHKEQQILCEQFKAEVEVLQAHSTTIRVGYQPIMHALTVRTTCMIEKIENKINARKNSQEDTNDGILRAHDKATITLKLLLGKKYLKPNTNILLCEGRTKVIGKIIETY